MKVYIHVRRGVNGLKDYWVYKLPGSGLFSLHPDFGLAEPFEEQEALRIAVMFCSESNKYTECTTVPVSQPELVPENIRKLVRLD